MPPDSLDSAIDAEIDAASALTIMDLDDKVLSGLITDLAQDIYTKPEICARYGITMEMLYDIVRRPGMAKRVKERRAIFHSGDNVQDRNRAYYATVAMDGALKLGGVVNDPKTPVSLLLDAITIASRNAGIYNTGTGKTEGATQIGAQFAVNITFSGGKTEHIGTTIDVQPLALPVTTVEEAA